MALNFNPELTPTLKPGAAPRLDAEPLRRNQRAAAQHIDDDYYVWRLSPGDFVEDTNAPGAVFGSTGSSQFAAIRFADAAAQGVLFSRRRPKLWLAGKFRIEIDYTSPVSLVSNFNLTVGLVATAKAGNLNTPSVLLLSAALLPGPALLADLQQFTIFTTTTSTGDAHLFGLQIRRDGVADANGNRLDIVAVTMTFLPATQEADVR